MHNASHGIELLIAGAAEYGPSKAGESGARLEDLGLFIEIREMQALQAGALAVFISEFNAASDERQKGITITSVGRATDMPSAVADAVAQWSLGVLPVLAQWRGKHSCMNTSRQIDTKADRFELLAGPVIARGHSDGDSHPARGDASFSDSLLPLMRSARPAQRLHWIELFACKFSDGSVDATCRLNNHDWLSGTKVQKDLASIWPTSSEPMRSCRQFALLFPPGGNTREIQLPTFWSRLLGRA